jgi:hypothetical protein
MASLESIHEKLRVAAENLDRAATETRGLPLEPTTKYIHSIGEAVANIFQIQQKIYRLRPDLQPDALRKEVPKPAPDLPPRQEALVGKLSEEEIQEIDKLLFSHAKRSWRKVAMLVGLAMMDKDSYREGIPDTFYSPRVRKLVEEPRLEFRGDLQYMRFGEVRLPGSKDLQEI